jgi:hypothetical protein
MFRLRCDRNTPCGSCVRLGRASACSVPSQQAIIQGNGPIDPGMRRILQDRIDQLESMVRSLLEKQPDSLATSTTGGTSRKEGLITHEFGRINLKEHESSYVESDHWMAILDDISDLKDMVNEPAGSFHHDTLQPKADLFLLQTYPTTKMEIIAAIPPRIIVDSMIAKYFKWADMPVSLVIHRGVFFKQYEAFWEGPLSTPIMWLTILFGMMYTVASCTLYINGGLEALDGETVAEYQRIISTSREKMIQCLRMGDYMKGTPHTIEALLTFLCTEYLQGEDTQQGCWQLTGVIIRVALKMGYHRDGSHFPEMSAFEAEMRRRTWYILLQFDIASASQVGLPRIIKQTQCDTAEPRNLLDDDFDATITILPPARPESEHTLSQFLAYKSRVISVYGQIIDFTTSSKQRNYDEALRLDALLSTAYIQKPSNLELKPMQRSIMDGAKLITRRLYIAMSFYHAQMTLHRKFMILAKTKDKFAYSHTTCINAALSAVGLQEELFEQCQPGRMLHADRWKILSLTQSEFLLATTVLCFNLDDDRKNRRVGTSLLCLEEVQKKSVCALRKARGVWEQQQAFSKEAKTAVKAISVVLGKFEGQAVRDVSDLTSSSGRDDSSFVTTPAAATPSTDSGIGIGEYIVPALSTSFSEEPWTNIPSASSFNTSVPHLALGNMGFDDSSFGGFFDMDQSWKTWLQFE